MTAATWINQFASLPRARKAAVLANAKSLHNRLSREDVLTIDELAERLKVSVGTIRRHLNHGPPKGSRGGDIRLIQQVRIGHQIRFNRASFEAFINGE